MLLHEMMKDIKPLLKEGFPEHWAEICALAMVGVSGNVPLKRAEDAWEKLYNAEEIHPSLNQKNLTSMLREVVEKMFDTYKTVLNADKLYLQSDESVFGHVFIAFLSLYIHCKLEQHLKNAKRNHKFTPIDLL